MINRLKFYSFLESPQIYSLTQKMLSPEAELLLRRQFKRIFDKSRKVVLDVGCGPSSPIQLPNGIIIGVDVNLLYVKKYIGANMKINLRWIKERTDGQVRFGCVCSADYLPFSDNVFDESRCLGVFHHLNRESVLSTIKEMVRCTRLGGKIIIFDSVWPKVAIYRPIAWLSCRFDRGKWMLTEKELLELVNTAYPENWQYRRFTYTFTGLEGLLLTIQKVTEDNPIINES